MCCQIYCFSSVKFQPLYNFYNLIQSVLRPGLRPANTDYQWWLQREVEPPAGVKIHVSSSYQPLDRRIGLIRLTLRGNYGNWASFSSDSRIWLESFFCYHSRDRRWDGDRASLLDRGDTAGALFQDALSCSFHFSDGDLQGISHLLLSYRNKVWVSGQRDKAPLCKSLWKSNKQVFFIYFLLMHHFYD